MSNFLSRSDISQMRLEIKGSLEYVQLFYVEDSIQIKRRFPNNDEVLKALAFLKPETQFHVRSSNWLQHHTKADTPKINDEWRELQFMDPNDLPCLSSENTTKN